MKIGMRLLTVLNYAGTILLMLLAGKEIGEFADLAAAGDDAGKALFFFLSGVVLLFGFYLVSVILHETGHLLGGLLTGWKFVSFRVGSLTLVNRGDRLQFCRANLPGTAGQCLLEPAEQGGWTLYDLGGGLMNLLTGGLLLCLPPFVRAAGAALLTAFGLSEVAIGWNNLFPMRLKSMTNDGYQLLERRKSPQSGETARLLMKAYAALLRARTYEELPGELVSRVRSFECADFSNISEVNLFSYRADFAFGFGDYDEAREISEKIAGNKDALGLFRTEARARLLYFLLLGGAPETEIDALYDSKELRAYLKGTACLPGTKRLMFAYHLLRRGDTEAAEKEARAMEAMRENVLCLPEYEAELREMERIRRIYGER